MFLTLRDCLVIFLLWLFTMFAEMRSSFKADGVERGFLTLQLFVSFERFTFSPLSL